MKFRYSLYLLACFSATTYANDSYELDKLSVTATKVQRATKEVSQSLAVVDSKEIDDKNIINISEALNTTAGVNVESSSNSSSAKLIIRGAGLKARFGVREIMVIKDGVPMTDPDSFTRFDFIDMQDVEAIEVQKGPGSILSSNATGGVIQLITKSVFDEGKDRIKLGFGTYGSSLANLRVSKALDEHNYIAINASKTKNDNSWRDNNEVESKQVSLKYGYLFDDEATFESELSYTKSDMQLPTSMTKDEFEEFEKSGKQEDTSSPWQHNARNSEILFFNTKYEKKVGNITYKPRFYFNTWEHFHPVTAMINDSDDNSVYGIDLELNYEHKLFSNSAMLVAGVTAKQDVSKNSKKYTYKDYTTTAGIKVDIDKTLSDAKGELANKEDSTSTLYGAYLQESFAPTNKSLVDISLRVDKVKFDVDGTEYLKYNWSGLPFGGKGTYYEGDGEYSIDETYTLFSPKLGVSYALSANTNIYASIASANQAPTDSELKTNRVENKGVLKKTRSINYEIGLKNRSKDYLFDMAIFQNDVKDEVTATKEGYTTYYQNAGKTQKRGFEFSGQYNFNKNFSLGASYTYSKFKFKEFLEDGTQNRSGNYLPYIPKNQYALFATFNYLGFKSRVQTRTWGSYYMDNANTQKYEGYKFVTDLMLGYERKNHSIQLNINNIFDKHYAMSVSKDINSDITYSVAAPRTAMLTYTYKF
ncbi:TonB-dependent receptor [Malaciobacter mytili LMG 24559]|uniref:TonB-dependent receptor n=1 Tax=Malaciobacter mytili LMG 24559 TaxID=1032238 RepID=A0AAX2AH34_9BACT|nr:TonB-dependent receptor [Malaciobacter mytili]AXH15153.1 TonB-dependent receptor [Malaciobacter mytili LMG 24559]RXK14761.1 TonB-dependent receptor [Malaciobacter mytili LMG 24559]